MSTTVLIPAAGSGSRLSTSTKKQFLLLGNLPVLARTIAVFDTHPLVDNIVLILPAEDLELCSDSIVKKFQFKKVSLLVAGGATRQESVQNGLQSCTGDPDDIILIHDGARPFVSPDTISRLIEQTKRTGAAITATPVTDTIKESNDGRTIQSTPQRQRLWSAQTPQVFRRFIIENAYLNATRISAIATDDASLVEPYHPISIVEGEYRNIKITTKEDMAIATLLLESEPV